MESFTGINNKIEHNNMESFINNNLDILNLRNITNTTRDHMNTSYLESKQRDDIIETDNYSIASNDDEYAIVKLELMKNEFNETKTEYKVLILNNIQLTVFNIVNTCLNKSRKKKLINTIRLFKLNALNQKYEILYSGPIVKLTKDEYTKLLPLFKNDYLEDVFNMNIKIFFESINTTVFDNQEEYELVFTYICELDNNFI